MTDVVRNAFEALYRFSRKMNLNTIAPFFVFSPIVIDETLNALVCRFPKFTNR